MRIRALTLAVLMTVGTVASTPIARGAATGQVRESGYVEVRDGTLLHYTVVRPAGSGPFPTLFEYSGYDPGFTPDAAYIDQFLPLGYAYIGVNLRGTGCSAGVWDFFQPVEALDGYDVVEWIATRPWSDGRVAMIGKSFPGITQLFVAAARPPHLVAIAPGHALSETYRDVAYPGGILNWAFSSLWTFIAQPYYSVSAGVQGSAGDAVCARHQAQRPANAPTNPFLQGVVHPYRDARHVERSAITYADRIAVPVWLVAAWQDEQVGPGAVNLIPVLQQRVPVHGFVSNGDHSMYRTDPGLLGLQQFYGWYLPTPLNQAAAPPGLDVWWEAGREGVRAPGFTTPLGSWPAATQTRRLFLSKGGALRAAGPGRGGPDAYAYAGPTGQGIQNPEAGGVGLPDRYIWDVKPAPGTALAYTSPPLTTDLAVLGSASLDLWLSSTAPDTDLQATITELRPDGQEVYVQAGWLRASHRRLDPVRSTPTRPVHPHTQADARPLLPGTPTAMRLEVFPFGHLFRTGSRIRVWIEGPKFLPELWGFAALPVPATNLVHHDAAHPSSLALPVVAGLEVPPDQRRLPDCGSVIRQPCRPS